jgi:hypothetical protein
MQQRINRGVRKQPSRAAGSPGQQQHMATHLQQEAGQGGIQGLWVDHPAGVREAYSAVPGLEDTSKFFQDGAHAMGRVFDLVKDTAVYKGELQTSISASDALDECLLHMPGC